MSSILHQPLSMTCNVTLVNTTEYEELKKETRRVLNRANLRYYIIDAIKKITNYNKVT